jgi:hypothetical protein
VIPAQAQVDVSAFGNARCLAQLLNHVLYEWLILVQTE